MKKPSLFIRYLNNEISITDMLLSFSESIDKKTALAAKNALESPPDVGDFKKELEDAVMDLIKDGPSEEFKAFVNNYMESSLEEDVKVSKSDRGENKSQTARVKDEDAPWIQGFICYNVCLYIKAFGLENLKRCRICSKFFDHKGKYAVYCSDVCKKNKKTE